MRDSPGLDRPHRLRCLYSLRRVHRVRRLTGWASCAALLLGACGGGVGGGTPPTYSIGGTVSGIDPGQSVVLRDNGGDDLTVSENGTFAFATRIASGGAYAVTVIAPQGVACSVTGGAGTVSATVASVAVACVSTVPLSIGATAFLGEFFFVANPGSDSVSEFSANATSGALLALGPAVATDRAPTSMAGTIDDTYFTRRYLYLGNSQSDDVSAFAVDAVTGALTAVPGSPFAAGMSPRAVAVYLTTACSTRGGHCFALEFLYVANSGSDTVGAYQIDQNTGVLTPVGSFATGKGPSAMATGAPFSPFLYVANGGGSNDISGFRVDGLSGGLNAILGSPFPLTGNVSSLALGAGDAFQYPPGESNGTPGYKGLLYAANATGATASIVGFSIHPYRGDANDGALTALPGFPYELPSCSYIATDQSGAYLYAAAGKNVYGFSVDSKTGALSPLPGSPVTVGANADSVSIDPTNKFLYVTSRSAGQVIGFRLNAATGELSAMPGSPFSVGQ